MYGTSNHKKRCGSDRSDSTSDTLLKVAREEPITEQELRDGSKDDLSDSDSNGSDVTQGEIGSLYVSISLRFLLVIEMIF